ncbi:MoaD/ThiS family protein [Candidatus Woesearchaeota archaeon]|nr:MoaD/ThiS family protein [Candidatus Woesearchaeota archaeon]
MVNVFIEKENKNVKAEARTVKELLEKLNINPETVLVTRDNELILLNEKLNNKDEIKLLSVISGG